MEELMVNPILVFKQKCKCGCHNQYSSMRLVYCLHHSCTGQRDFEKCDCKDCHSFFHKIMDIVTNEKLSDTCPDCQFWCKGTGYKIPFKDYEIKKVSEINCRYNMKLFCSREDCIECEIRSQLEGEHNLKGEDKVVINYK